MFARAGDGEEAWGYNMYATRISTSGFQANYDIEDITMDYIYAIWIACGKVKW